MKTDTKVIIAGVLVLGLGVWYVQRQVAGAVGGIGQGITDLWSGLGASMPTPGDVQQGIGSGVGYLGNYIGGAGAGAVEGIGLAVGIPRTSVSECARAKAEGRWWDASFHCPAGDFISSGVGSMFGSTAVQQAQQADVRRIDNMIDYTDPANPFVNQAGTDFRYF